jgi:peptidoglycan/LPS O-acetylase OafA/YrhL
MLVADLYKNETSWVKKKHLIWDLIAPICLIIMAYTWTEELGKTVLLNVALLGLFLAAIKGRIFPTLLSLRGITIIGCMCYTIYLIHLPLLEILYSFIGNIGQSTSWGVQLSLSLLIAFPLVLLSSMIGYKLIEQPFMKRNALTHFKGLLGLASTKKVSVSK